MLARIQRLDSIKQHELQAMPKQYRRSVRAMSGNFEEDENDSDEDGGSGGAGAAVGVAQGFTGPIPEEADAYVGYDASAASAARNRKHRAQVIGELLTTEREYVTDLEIIVDMFMARGPPPPYMLCYAVRCCAMRCCSMLNAMLCDAMLPSAPPSLSPSAMRALCIKVVCF